MRNLLLTVPHPLLCTLNFLFEEDDFIVDSVAIDETRYTRGHCGWTCRVRAVVITTKATAAERRHFPRGRSVPRWEYLLLQIEIQREGICRALLGDIVRPARDAVDMYVRSVRALVHSFPLELYRAKPEEIPPSDMVWRHTPFASVHVLNYLAHVRWQDGRLDEAKECYEALMPTALESPRDAALVRQRLGELKAGVAYDDRKEHHVAPGESPV